MATPVFINCRDRVSPLIELVKWLEAAGCDEIYLLDNDSAYEPLLEYYRETPHEVVRLGRNFGHFALWQAPGVFELTRGRPFVYTDPDVVPDPACPADALERFDEILRRYPGVNKAGFGLRLDDIPDHYAHKQAVLAWEAQQWRWRLRGGAYFAAIDTTFALHRPHAGARPADAIRTGPPYVARHTSWYVDLDALSEEEVFYRARAGASTNWTGDELPSWLTRELARLDARSTSWAVRVLLQLRVRAQLYRRLRRPSDVAASG